MTITAFPLTWPAGVPRTAPMARERARFSTRKRSPRGWAEPLTLAEARDRLMRELEQMMAEDAVLSTNVELRLDGMPRADRRAPDDPGAAVYWHDVHTGEPRCLPCDRWTRVEDNVASIAAALGALRGLDRWVSDYTVQQAFTGFAALPDPDAFDEDWRKVLGLQSVGTVTRELVDRAYRALAQRNHPDREGGSEAAMARLNRARERAREAIG